MPFAAFANVVPATASTDVALDTVSADVASDTASADVSPATTSADVAPDTTPTTSSYALPLFVPMLSTFLSSPLGLFASAPRSPNLPAPAIVSRSLNKHASVVVPGVALLNLRKRLACRDTWYAHPGNRLVVEEADVESLTAEVWDLTKHTTVFQRAVRARLFVSAHNLAAKTHE